MGALPKLLLTALLMVGGCASLPVDYPRHESHALQDTAATRLGRAGLTALRAHPGQNGFRPLSSGVDALLARVYLAQAADRSLDLMYFKWNDDLVGRQLIHAVMSAADRGVRVRILVDDVGTKVNDNNVMALSGHPHVEIRLFNPIASRANRLLGALSDFGRVNRRMHNKAFIADNQRAILGGRNIGNEYFDAREDWNFEDLDVLVAGPIVPEVSAVFDQFWNAPLSYPISALTGKRHETSSLDVLRAELAASVESQSDSAYAEVAKARAAELLSLDVDGEFWGGAQLVFDEASKVTRNRDDVQGHLMPQLARQGAQLESTLTIVSPYFIPGDAGVAWLTGLVKRGVRVNVLTNSLATTDVSAVHASYRRYREALVKDGVRLYELRPDAFDVPNVKRNTGHLSGSEASLHAKTFFFDRRAVFIGSLNLDPRSLQLNTEIGIVCESAEMTETLLGKLEPRIERIAWQFERAVLSSGETGFVWTETASEGVRRRTSEPEVSVWRKLGVWLLGLLPIESQL